jgi:hypothetical protein
MLYGLNAIREAGRFDVADPTVAEAIEAIYASIKDDNRDLDIHMATLKVAMAREGAKEAVFEPSKLALNNRQGRKLMQAYFRQKGITIGFKA